MSMTNANVVSALALRLSTFYNYITVPTIMQSTEVKAITQQCWAEQTK